MWRMFISLGIGALALAGAFAAYHLPSAPAPAPLVVGDLDPEEIKLVALGMDLDPGERVWERIPWVKTLEEATALSEASKRPIFLFSMWGELDSRC